MRECRQCRPPLFKNKPEAMTDKPKTGSSIYGIKLNPITSLKKTETGRDYYLTFGIGCICVIYLCDGL